MNRRVIALAAGAVLLAQGAVHAQAGWEKFTHQQYGFSVSYPAGWEAKGGNAPLAFVAMGPEAAGINGVRVNVNVTTETVPADLTVEKFEAVSESRMGLLFQGYRRLRTDRTTVGTAPALLRYYTWKRNDGVELYQMQLYVIAGRRAYVVTGTTSAQSANLAREAGLLVQIIQTFRP